MQRISDYDLVKLLEGDFSGKVKFSGRVYIRLQDERNSDFYRGSGDFALQRVGRTNGAPENSLELRQGETALYITPKRDTEFKLGDAYIKTRVITFPITFPCDATVQLEPHSITY